ncbi:MAG TPA: sporulation protein YabP [Candidatus Faecivivens stercorigallinarum]|nr:sporulation protein YabP [Candidatus Faecivivens stercorigallinarum]
MDQQLARDRNPQPAKPHRLSLDSRKRLELTGVKQVECFDDTFAVLDTTMGRLEIRGQGLAILDLSSDGGDLSMTGTVSALFYQDDQPRAFFGRGRKK